MHNEGNCRQECNQPKEEGYRLCHLTMTPFGLCSFSGIRGCTNVPCIPASVKISLLTFSMTPSAGGMADHNPCGLAENSATTPVVVWSQKDVPLSPTSRCYR